MPVVGVLAGDGHGDVRDGEAERSRFSDPFGVALGRDGVVYISDGAGAHRIRAIAPDGVVSTLAGGVRGFADGTGADAQFDTPSGLAVDPSGALIVADTGNDAIRRVTADGRVTTIAGGRRAGARGAGRFNGPLDVAVAPSGRIIVADTYNDRIAVVERDGHVWTLAGGHRGSVDGAAVDARFDTPSGVAVDRHGTIFVADTGNHLVRAISPSGRVRTMAMPADIGLIEPVGVAVDERGAVYVTDSRGRIIEWHAGTGRVLAGSAPGFAPGRGREARFRRPAGVAAIEPGRLLVADAGNALIRALEAPSRRALVRPSSPFIAPSFDLEAFAWRPLLWPLDPLEGPFEIAGTLGEARGTGADRFHTGIDIRADQGASVVAVRDGTVASPVSTGAFGTLNEWVRIGEVTYVHLRVGRDRAGRTFDPARFVPTRDDDGRVIGMRVKRGAHFTTGDRIGTVNAFNHVHVNVGWPGEEHNPLRFRLVQFRDTIPPTIPPGGIRLYDRDGQPLVERARGRLLVSGSVQIIVDAWDQVNGNRADRRLGLFSLGYQVLHPDGLPAPGFEQPRETIRFDQLAASDDAASLVYAAGSGIPFYGERRTRFLYVVTNTFRGGIARPGMWDTRELPAGDYTLRVIARDASGNEAVRHRDLAVTIVPPEAHNRAAGGSSDG